jgi:hypothetical protein
VLWLQLLVDYFRTSLEDILRGMEVGVAVRPVGLNSRTPGLKVPPFQMWSWTSRGA